MAEARVPRRAARVYVPPQHGAWAFLGLPLVLAWAGVRIPLRAAKSYPDPFAVLLLVVAFVVTFLLPSGVLSAGLAAIVASLALVAAGLLFVEGALSPRGWPAIAIAMVGWVALGAWAIIRGAPEGSASVVVATVTGEILLAVLLLRALRARMREDERVEVMA